MIVTCYDIIRWKYVMEYSKEIGSLLGYSKSPAGCVIEDPKTVLKVNLQCLYGFLVLYYNQ